ncbi:hypothetical protein DDE18_15650 [Nocardioides gansuensis]|uniref:Uncharacterized protein n=1 Tax=Nocardioides gansuensis TaxID=2138300 RepID=A0A2T8F8Q7_9ACTN|nr:hypothetical protein DDE18_15650 [Nocardioides gansuensis]
MQRLRLILAIGLAVLMSVAPCVSTIAAAGEPECYPVQIPCPPNSGKDVCWKQVCTGGDDHGGGDDGSGTGTGGEAYTKCMFAGREVPCVGPAGTWSAAHSCWLTLTTPQQPPPAGTKDEDGDWYWCTPPPPYIGSRPPVWIEGPAITWVDPGPLAAQVAGTMPLAKPETHMAPKPPLMTYVGLETWLWIPESQWKPLSASTSLSGATVTVTATPVRVSWNMTEASVRCFSPGRPWVRGMSSDEVTDCDYVYQTVSDGQPDGAYKVSAQLAYKVAWTCTGPCLGTEGSLGILPGPVSDRTNLRVGERQSVVIR